MPRPGRVVLVHRGSRRDFASLAGRHTVPRRQGRCINCR
jgi:hypothetical protein